MTQPDPNQPQKPEQSENASNPGAAPTKPPHSSTDETETKPSETTEGETGKKEATRDTIPMRPKGMRPQKPAAEENSEENIDTGNDAGDEDSQEDSLKETRPLLHNGATTNRLPTENVIALENSGLIYGHATDVGQHRKNNEDSLLAYGFSISSMDEFPDFGVFIIADGMGGHKDGDRASATAVRSIATGITRKLYFNILRGTPMSQLPPVNELLVEEVENANAEIRSITSDGGTTCTAALVIGRRVFIAHTGDSRAYLVKVDGIERITRDHSLAERLRETGVMTEQEAAMHPQGNQLYSALGMSDDPRIDSWTRTLNKGTRLLLCSDGLWGMVPDGQIYSIMMQHPVPQDACNRLVAAANENGGMDNISAIILYMP